MLIFNSHGMNALNLINLPGLVAMDPQAVLSQSSCLLAATATFLS